MTPKPITPERRAEIERYKRDFIDPFQKPAPTLQDGIFLDLLADAAFWREAVMDSLRQGPHCPFCEANLDAGEAHASDCAYERSQK